MTLPQPTETCASCGANGRPVQELGDDLILRARCGQCGAPSVDDSIAPVIPIRPDVAPPPVARAATPKNGEDLLAAAEARLAAIDAALAEHDQMKREAKQLRRMIAAYKRR